MSCRLQAVALFATVSIGSCLFFLAMSREARLFHDVAAVESNVKASRKPRELASVVVAPLVAQDATNDHAPESVERIRERSFYYQNVKTRRPKEPNAAPDVFPVANPDADEKPSPQFSVWANFPPGSWARRRYESAYVENGKTIQSVTESRFMLKSVDFEKQRYVLQCDTTIKMGDLGYPKRAEIVEYNFWDMIADDDEREEELGAANLMIGSRVVPCRVRRLVRQSESLREITTIWYSPVVAPYVLQRETIREPLGDRANDDAVRELFVVQSASCGTNVVSEALFSKRDGVRETTGASLRSSVIPGAVAHETLSETEEESLYQTKTTLLDYYVAQ